MRPARPVRCSADALLIQLTSYFDAAPCESITFSLALPASTTYRTPAQWVALSISDRE